MFNHKHWPHKGYRIYVRQEISFANVHKLTSAQRLFLTSFVRNFLWNLRGIIPSIDFVNYEFLFMKLLKWFGQENISSHTPNEMFQWFFLRYNLIDLLVPRQNYTFMWHVMRSRIPLRVDLTFKRLKLKINCWNLNKWYQYSCCIQRSYRACCKWWSL